MRKFDASKIDFAENAILIPEEGDLTKQNMYKIL